MIETPTPSRRNFSAARAASAAPPMQVSAMTHSTGSPQGWRRFRPISSAVAFAMAMVWASSDSRTPRRRPSMAGRMPIFGRPPCSRFAGGTVFMPFRFAIARLLAVLV